MNALKSITLAIVCCYCSICVLYSHALFAEAPPPLPQTAWVEQQMQRMTPDERIGQLFMVAAYSNRDEGHKQHISQLITQYNLGGLIFFQGTAVKQAQLTNFYQTKSKIPLLIAIDGEWGLSMRLDNTPKYPRQLMLGAIQDNNLIYEMGKDIARQCKRMGIHVNLAPVVDVNNNPKNPIINDRSFGEDKYNVARKGVAYMQGMEMNGILSCAKHFPGHGDTDKDSHHTLPTIKHDKYRIQDLELYPFREMIKMGVSGVMVAHLAIPSLDNEPISSSKPNLTMPTTLSKKVVTDLLKNEMGYNGLVFTDALNMKGVSSHFSPGIVDVKALLAGNDVLLFSENVGRAVSEIKKAISSGEISQAEIDERVRKILRAKYRAGLHNPQTIALHNLNQDLNSINTEVLIRQLAENAMTLARDDYRQIPFTGLDTKTFASLSIGASTLTKFQSRLGKYAPVEHHTLRKSDSDSRYAQKLAALKKHSHVVVALHGMSRYASKDYGINSKALNLIKQLQQSTNVTVVLFGSPYALKFFDNASTILVAYEQNAITEDVAAQVLFGGIAAKGKLPITASPTYQVGDGLTTFGQIRLKYTIPEDVGIQRADLNRIDNIVEKAISDKATPGCQVFIAKDGKVIFEKAYGYHTYNRRNKVKTSDLYDLASITKISATVLSLMEMYDNQSLNLNGRLADYLPETQGTNKQNLIIRDILIHESGLRSWIPFYEETLPYSIYHNTYATAPNTTHSIEVAKNMYMRDTQIDQMWRTIYNSPLPNKGEYKYSDVGYYFFKKIIEDKYAYKSLDEHVSQRFYKPLGLTTMTFKPSRKFSTYSIPPTENDVKWRKQIVQGYVHDMGAAMMDGVGGHAGLFSNANDLGVIMHMLINGGNYGARSYVTERTIKTFTAAQKKGSRRALGFDRPEHNTRYKTPASRKASTHTFGHTGFTGTCAWADPDNGLVYVFLSNRTYPKMNNYKLVKNNVRTKIHDAIYDAIALAKARGRISG